MKSTQNRKQTSWTCTGVIGKSTGCTCRCRHRIAGKIQLCEAGGGGGGGDRLFCDANGKCIQVNILSSQAIRSIGM